MSSTCRQLQPHLDLKFRKLKCSFHKFVCRVDQDVNVQTITKLLVGSRLFLIVLSLLTYMLALEVRLPSYLLSKGSYLWAVRIYCQKFYYVNRPRLKQFMFCLIFMSKAKTITLSQFTNVVSFEWWSKSCEFIRVHNSTIYNLSRDKIMAKIIVLTLFNFHRLNSII